MPRDPRTYIWDARRAATLITEFVAGADPAEYRRTAVLTALLDE